jgi:hypothetical protein
MATVLVDAVAQDLACGDRIVCQPQFIANLLQPASSRNVSFDRVLSSH